MDEARRETLTVGPDDRGRLDSWLAARLGLSRTRVAGLIKEDLVTVDGEAVRKSEPVEPGQRVEVTVPPPEPIEAEPEDIPLDIVFEDPWIVVVNKPPDLVVHPAPGHPHGTLVNALLHHVQDLSGIGGALRPGIVHRLDRDTSGLLVVAKNDEAHRKLSAALKARDVDRLYLAATWGHLPQEQMVIDAPVGRHERDRTRMAVTPDGRPARTHVTVRERWVTADLLEVTLETGRTHQIRVHLESVGHPVVGDDLYGPGRERGMSGPGRGWARELARRTRRQFLHAAELAFDHPATGEPLRFHAPLPEDLAAVVSWVRETEAMGRA